MDTFEVKETRTGSVRRITLNHACVFSIRHLIQSLKEREGKDLDPSDLLFKGRRGALSVSTLNNLVKKWCAEIDLKGNYGGHSLRKTYGYHQLFRFGASVDELMIQFNHSKKWQTFEYLCVGSEELKRFEQKTGLKKSRPSHDAFKKRTRRPVRTDADFWESEEIYRVLFEDANDGILLIDTEGKVIEANEANERIYGWTREEIVGKNVFGRRALTLENPIRNLEDMKLALADGSLVGIRELKVIRKDGTQGFVEVSDSVVKKGGKLAGVITVCRDITDRKRVEQALQESEEIKGALLNATTDAVILLDLEGGILDINAAYADKFGRQLEDIIGLCLWDLVPSDLRGIKESIDHAITTGKPIRFEKEYREEWTDNIVYPVSDMQGNISRVAVFSHDITIRKQAEEALRQHRDHLEELVKERTVNLEQANTALKVLLKRRDEDKIELEDKIVLNVKELVLPFLEDLKKSRSVNEQKALTDIIEHNLNDIISPFVKVLSSKYYNLTPTEIQIANLIKQGKSSKEIAEKFKMSPRTIDIHRYHIRKKLGISSKKANLRTHLLSIN